MRKTTRYLAEHCLSACSYPSLSNRKDRKRFLFACIFVASCLTSVAQLDASFAKDTVAWTRLPNMDVTGELKVTVAALNTGPAPNTLTVNLAAAAPAGLTRFVSVPLTPAPATSELSFSLTLLRGINPDDNALYVPLQLSYNNGTGPVTKTMILRVINARAETKKEATSDDGFFSRLTFLNAYNFDFYGKLSSNYVGIFNIYHPGNARGKRGIANRFLFFKVGKEGTRKWQWGINAGIMKINYGLGDENPAETFLEQHVKIRALDSVLPGRKYLRQYNKYSTTITNNTWSFYGQPLILLNPSSFDRTESKIYFHTHFELLVTKLKTMTVMTKLEEDTAFFPGNVTDRFPIRDRLGDTMTRDDINYNGYFGAGLTFDIKLPHSNSGLFLQVTGGVTTATPGPVNVPRYRNGISAMTWQGFYLVRAAFTQRLSDATKLVVAQDIRGLLPRYNPVYATYVGLNIKLDELLKLIKD